MNAFLTICRYTLLEVRHGHLIWISLLVGALMVGTGYFLQAISLIDAQTSAVSIVAPLLRLACVAVVGAFVVSSTCRALEQRQLDMILSAPVSRSGWLAGRLAGLGGAACIVAGAAGLALMLIHASPSVAWWSISLTGELILVAALGLLLAVSLVRQPAALLGLAAIYLCARMIGTIQMIQSAAIPSGLPANNIPTDSTSGVFVPAGQWLIDGLALLLPRLDLMAQTKWLAEDTGFIATTAGLSQAAVYVAIAIAAAIFDFDRRDV